MKLRSLVVDDEDLPRRRVRELASAHAGLEVVGEAADGAAAVDAIIELKPDLVFLDIQMPEMDGFQVLDTLEEAAMPAVVFVTAYDAHAIRAFEVGALDYLLKPIAKERFDAAVDRVLRRSRTAQLSGLRELAETVRRERGYSTRLVARLGGRHYFVPVSEVIRLEAEGNYLRLHTARGEHLVRHTMKEIEARLDPSRFVRIHRSIIIALDHVRAVMGAEHGEYIIELDDGSVHTSSRTYSPRVRALLHPGG